MSTTSARRHKRIEGVSLLAPLLTLRVSPSPQGRNRQLAHPTSSLPRGKLPAPSHETLFLIFKRTNITPGNQLTLVLASLPQSRLTTSQQTIKIITAQPELEGVIKMTTETRGGRRPGAGAPRGNLNSLKHGQRSKQLDQAIERLASDPELKPLLAFFVRFSARQHSIELERS